MLTGAESPYDVTRDLMYDLHSMTADFSNEIFAMWGWLTDGMDGPPAYARGLTQQQLERLMRQAAQEWLDLDLSADNVRTYLARWDGWPESVLSDG